MKQTPGPDSGWTGPTLPLALGALLTTVVLALIVALLPPPAALSVLAQATPMPAPTGAGGTASGGDPSVPDAAQALRARGDVEDAPAAPTF